MKNKIIGSLLFLLGALELYILGNYNVPELLTHYGNADGGLFLLLISFCVVAVGVTVFFWEVK